MERVASFNHTRNLMTQALRVQTKLAHAQIQESTGVKSTDYEGVSDTARVQVRLESEMARADQFVANGEVVSSRVETTYSTLGSLVDLATEARTWISNALSGTNDSDTGLNVSAEGALEDAASLLNTTLDGRYLFAGARTNSAPVDLSDYDDATSPSTADTSYYKGDDMIASYQAAPDDTIQYSVTANESGIEKLIRGLSLTAGVTTSPLDTDTLEEAYELISNAVDEILNTQTNVSNTATRVEKAISANLDYQLYTQGVVEDLKSVDLAEVAANISTLQTQLEASYSVVTTLQRTSLLDFL